MLVIGSSKEGKSSLCNILAGMNHNDNFFVNNERSTAVKKISWRGNESETLTLIDTPGLYGVDQNVEDENIQEMVNKLWEIKYLNTFLIVINGSNPRFDQHRKQMIRKYQNIFGHEFLERNTVFAVTHWPHDERSVKSRKRTGMPNEETWTHELNKTLSESFHIHGTVPAVFIDCRHNANNEQEARKFEQELNSLNNLIRISQPYSCKEFCPS